MTPDEFCIALLKQGDVYVDAAGGLAYTRRLMREGQPKQLGAFNTHGYLVCTLHLNNERKQIKVHRLIWIAANGAIPDGVVIDHINGCKSDNRITNLRLADPVLNSRNRRSYRGTGNPAAKLTAELACEIRRAHSLLHSYQIVSKQFGVSRSLVAQIVRGELWV